MASSHPHIDSREALPGEGHGFRVLRTPEEIEEATLVADTFASRLRESRLTRYRHHSVGRVSRGPGRVAG